MTTIAMVGSVVNHGSGLEIATQTEDVEISWNFYTNLKVLQDSLIQDL